MGIMASNSSPFDSDPEIENAHCSERSDEAKRLIETVLAAMPKGWSPLSEGNRGIDGTFWDEDEFRAYSEHCHSLGESRTIFWMGPSYSKRWWQLAVINKNKQNYQEAIDCIERGLQLEPDHPYLWMQRGLVHSCMTRYDEALFAYQMAESVRPWSPSEVRAWSLRSQGHALIELSRLSEAKQVYARSLELEPGDENAENELDYIDHLLDQQELRRRKIATPADLYRGYLEGGEDRLAEMLGDMPEDEEL